MTLLAITFISLLFVGIGFTITEKNAPYLLAGYNTMSKEEQELVDLKGLLIFFKKFHVVLGASQAIIGYTLYLLDFKESLSLFLGTYSIVGYIYFIIRSAHFKSNKNENWKIYLGVVVLSLCLIGILGTFYYSSLDNKLTLEKNQLVISGMYGEKISLDNIESIQLDEGLPTITKRTNGFSTNTHQKGYFKTEENKLVKLIINKQKIQFIFIDKKKGKDIYYNNTDKNLNEIFSALKNSLKPILFDEE